MKRLVIAAAAIVAAAGLGGCSLAATPAGDPNLVKRSEAYAAYMTVYDGCPADFQTVYRGTMYVADLPEDTRAQLADPRQPKGLPAIADEFGGMVATLPDHPDQVIMLDPYSGVCE